MHKRRVVVTGLGVISSIGLGKDAFWKASLEGHSGVSLIENFDTSRYRSKIAGQIRDFNPDNFIEHDIVRKVDRFVHFGLAATKLAIEESGIISTKEDRNRIGVVYGSGLGGILFHEEQILKGYEKGTHRLNPLCVPRITPNAVSSQIAIAFGFYGPNLVISNACASGTNAIGEAYRKIQYREADIIVTGGAEAPLTEFTFGAYDVLRALSRRNHAPLAASRPFDAGRDGFVLAEGAATLVLEELTHAMARGAPIFAEIAGYATGSGAYHMVIPRPEGDDAACVMKQALGDAGMTTADIGYINAHGTSTVLNDVTETKAIRGVFGTRARAIPISSTKSMLGHSIGAAGALEAAVSCLALTHQIIPPTINYETPDPACDLDCVPNTPRYGVNLGAVLSNSFGFGSNNACLVLKRYTP